MKISKTKLDLAMATACITSNNLYLKSDLPRGTFLNAITGKNVRPATVGKIAKALNVPVQKLSNKHPCGGCGRVRNTPISITQFCVCPVQGTAVLTVCNYPDTKLVIIDTFIKIRGEAKRNE